MTFPPVRSERRSAELYDLPVVHRPSCALFTGLHGLVPSVARIPKCEMSDQLVSQYTTSSTLSQRQSCWLVSSATACHLVSAMGHSSHARGERGRHITIRTLHVVRTLVPLVLSPRSHSITKTSKLERPRLRHPQPCLSCQEASAGTMLCGWRSCSEILCESTHFAWCACRKVPDAYDGNDSCVAPP
jgi:hypothetical protein